MNWLEGSVAPAKETDEKETLPWCKVAETLAIVVIVLLSLFVDSIPLTIDK